MGRNTTIFRETPPLDISPGFIGANQPHTALTHAVIGLSLLAPHRALLVATLASALGMSSGRHPSPR